jgi:hypothetical protein
LSILVSGSKKQENLFPKKDFQISWKSFLYVRDKIFNHFCLSIISILGIAKTYTAIVIVAPLMVLALPIFDTLSSIVRRVISGKSLKAIIQPDANHLHHKMLKKGFTQKQTVLILYGVSAIFGMFAIILMESGIWKALSFALIIFVIIAMGYKEFFKQRLLAEDTSETNDSEPIEGQTTLEEYDNIEHLEKYRKYK